MNEIEKLLYGRKGSKKKPMDLFGNSKKQINFGFNSMGIFRDSDRDGVIDVLDCRPHNPRKQHIRPSHAVRERLKDIPVYVTDETVSEEEEDEEIEKKSYQITSKEAKKKAPKARKRFLSIIKKHPSTVGDIERTKVRRVVVSSKAHPKVPGSGFIQPDPIPMKGKIAPEKRAHKVFIWAGIPDEEKIERRVEEAVKRGKDPKEAMRGEVKKYLMKYKMSEEEAEKQARQRIHGKKPPFYTQRSREKFAEATAHELEHVKQYRRWAGKPKLAERMMGREKTYEEKPFEKQARRAGSKALSKRERAGYGTKKHFTRQLTRTLGETPEDEREKRRLI